MTTIVLALGIAALTSAAVVAFVRDRDGRVEAPALAEESGTHESGMHAAYAFDPDDERQLVGEVQNVFVGEVQKQTGTDKAKATKPEAGSAPMTQHAVEVREVIKGELGVGSAVIVTQTGGFDEEIKEDVFVEGDERLKPGKEYMFSINYDPEHRWNVIVAAPYGDVPIDNGQERAALKEKFKKAKKVSEATKVDYEAPVPQEWADDGALDAKEPGGAHKH